MLGRVRPISSRCGPVATNFGPMFDQFHRPRLARNRPRWAQIRQCGAVLAQFGRNRPSSANVGPESGKLGLRRWRPPTRQIPIISANVRTKLENGSRQGVPNTLPEKFPEGAGRVRRASVSDREFSASSGTFRHCKSGRSVGQAIQERDGTASAPGPWNKHEHGGQEKGDDMTEDALMTPCLRNSPLDIARQKQCEA